MLTEPDPRNVLADLVAERDDPDLARFVGLYYRDTPADLLATCRPDDLFGAAVSHRELAATRAPGEPAVRVFNPSYEIDGWRSPNTVIQTVTDDAPFIVDSVGMAVDRAGYATHRVVHPVLAVSRDADGQLLTVSESGGDPESMMAVEFDRIADPAQMEALRQHIVSTLTQVVAAVAGWKPMVAEAEHLAKTLAASPDPDTDSAEAGALLEWLVDDNFIFLGYRRYELTRNGGLELRSVPGTGLGILADEPGEEPTVVRFDELPAEIGARATTLDPIHITTTNGRSLVHRPSRMDYIGVKIIDGDRVVGEHRFLGLFTAASYRWPLHEVPIVRKVVAGAIEASGYARASHNASELLAAIDRYPRDELFQMSPAELAEITSAMVHLGRRREVGVFARPEPFGRFVSCLVLLPRDQLTTGLRHRIEVLLRDAFEASAIDHTATQLGEAVHAQLHYVITRSRGGPMPDLDELRDAVSRLAYRWTDELRDALREAFGDAEGGQLYQRYANAFGPAYTEEYSTRAALSDITRFERSPEGPAIGVELYRPLGAPPGRLQFKIHRVGATIRLSDVLPLLTNLGADVLEEQPHDIEPADGPPIHLYDFSLDVPGLGYEMDDLKPRFEGAFGRAWRGESENDSFNRLVMLAGMSWADVRVVRAYAAYFRQVRPRYSAAYVADTLVNHSHITRDLVELFAVRFDPSLADADRADCQAAATEVGRRIAEAIENVVELDEDRILRAIRDLIGATTRTSYFRRDPDGSQRPYLALKFDPSQVPDLPRPHPRYETFVFSARTEGVHLRAGEVARGGIRWSTRLEDYRTEVLGLMTTQVAKNSVIVPTGGKGGFIAKRLQPTSNRAATAAEVEACYRLFISGLLDVTDNLVNGAPVHPDGIVSHDDDGAYLVVAADKGTATFSDVANEISTERGFWLGDAFASGGSAGYDHKSMGITARGAWESVRRHFRALGVDVDRDRFTVVGIGDMSGDVFGNGMLLSRQIALIGAFDHRHILIDPDPDPETSWRERQRLFAKSPSSWDDYDRSLLSPGGAIISRAAKSVDLSPEARQLLGLDPTADADSGSLTPNELIRKLLTAPYDLFWNGGIGTFVKASTETDLDAADKANDTIRVDASDLRCQVVGEGGNLGLTPLARVEAALAGVRLMSDAIDNSAGVATSDVEVNIKILLDAVVASGDLTTKQRNELLAEMTDEVADLVLATNYAQGRTIENALAEGFQMLEVHERLITELADRGLLDRSVELVPSADELIERRGEKVGLTAPELSGLLAHVKNALSAELRAADIGLDPWFDHTLLAYFPSALRERFAHRIAQHRLRSELVATIVANRVVDRGGITMVMRLADETGAAWADVARAHTASWELFAMGDVWDQVAALDNLVASDVQIQILLRGRRLVERSTRWLLRQRRRPIDVTAVLADFGHHLATARELVDSELTAAHRLSIDADVADLVGGGVPTSLAEASIGHDRLARTLDLIETSRTMGCPLADAATVWFRLETRLGLDWLNEAIADLPRSQRWQSMARSALRAELSQTHAELTTTVLRDASRQSRTPDSHLVDTWLDTNAAAVQRIDALRSAIIAERAAGTEPLTVILRELRSLAGG